MLYLYLLQYFCILYKIYQLVALIIGEYFRVYFLYMVCYAAVSILIDLHSKKYTNTSLFKFTIYLSHELKHIYLLLIYQYLI